ncbi:uncharacterized protein LOC111897209 [Lactuca sativa]|uniref:HR-like lesion-inducer n=3 Tax=Lactuca TaxID=4235 RepID=A0AA35UMX2_LACSI|nr:uncharacterized protein LOC111897209 [Lactuca sativa]KAJ0203105.1 hypothetical protein LSAT_V11C500254850 [Lactuca sativa]CAH1427042.1 unnamed protein product [Lactuca virosa]CAI9261506.1 unnamed protein product [Lactuca saligna]
MGFVSFLGRVLFASLFILSAWQTFNDFDDDGGPAADELAPKVAILHRFLTSKFGHGVPRIDVKHFILAGMALKGLGGIVFVFGSSTGAHLLMYYLLVSTPILYDFFNYKIHDPMCHMLLADFLQNVALFGALLFFVEMKKLSPRKMLRKKLPKSKTT